MGAGDLSIPFQLAYQTSEQDKRTGPCAKNNEPPFIRRVLIQNGQSSAQNHNSVLYKHGSTMTPSAQNQPLIIMLPMGLPDLFATERPSDQGHRRVHNEWRKNHDRDPQLEYSVANPKDHQCPSQESDRNAPRIAHEDTRRREIVGEKS